MLDDTESATSLVFPDDAFVFPELVDTDAVPVPVPDAALDDADDDDADDDEDEDDADADAEYIFDHGRFIIKSSNVSQSYFNEINIARTDPTEHEYIVLILFIFHFFSRCK
jgi:hypothetical protein